MRDGVMAQIQRQLRNGLSAAEVIAGGYPKSTVYRAQWELRRSEQLSVERTEPPTPAENPEAAVDVDDDLDEALAALREELDEALEAADSRIEELETANGSLLRQLGELAARLRQIEAQLPALHGAALEWEEFRRKRNVERWCQWARETVGSSDRR